MKFPLAYIKKLKPWARIPLYIAVFMLMLFVVVWIALDIYIQFNKKSLLEKITSQLNDNINGKVSVENLDLALLKGFPGVSVELEQVLLRDSLWETHHHDLLNARHIYISVNVLSLLKKSPVVRNINIADASVYIYVDSSGYSNTSVLERSTGVKKDERRNPEINHLSFSDVNFTFDNRTKKKLFRIAFDDLDAKLSHNNTGWVAKTHEDLVFKDFAFNQEKGSFLKDKRMRAHLTFHFDDGTKTLFVPKQMIRLDEDKVQLWAKFIFSTSPPQFLLKFVARQIEYKNAVALTSPNIQQKLNLMDLKKPVDLFAFVNGKIKFRDTPIVKVSWAVKNNVFVIPGGEISDCNFTGYFMNSAIPGLGMNDKNSLVSVPVFTGEYSGIPFNADSLVVRNLMLPMLSGNLHATFRLDKLNEAIGSDALSINKGMVNLALTFKVGLSKNDYRPPILNGYVKIDDLGFKYVPRNISFNNSNVTLLFAGSDLLVQQAKLQSKSSVLNVKGIVRNFLNLYYTAPDKIVLDWNIQSPLINLNEFQSFLAARRKTQHKKVKASNAAANKVAAQLDDVFDKSEANMQLSISKVIYKKFAATNINAMMQLNGNNIVIQNAIVHNSGGQVMFDALINQRGKVNDVALQANIDNVNVQRFFYEFNDFGQAAITSKNINGNISANVDAKTRVTDGGDVVGGSMSGGLSFVLSDGELNNFDPFLKIGKFIFKKRNLDSVSFRDIKGQFDFMGDEINIHPMRIESSAFNMAVQGVYGLNKGTNILIDLPLRNPKKDADILNDSLRAKRSMKGIVLHLQAVDGDDGKVKIKLRTDAIRKKAEELHEQEEEEKLD